MLLVRCPRCGRVGRLHYARYNHKRRIYFRVYHPESRQQHYVRVNEPIVVVGVRREIILNYLGGDYLLVPVLLQMMPKHKVYVEVFGGGAFLLLNKPPSWLEVYNDLDGDLVNLFMVLRDRPQELKERFGSLLLSRKVYYDLLRSDPRDPVDRAARYLYIILVSIHNKFGGGVYWGPTARTYTTLIDRTLRRISRAHRRLRRVLIEQADFRQIIRKYDTEDTFFYLDPPHLQAATEYNDYYRVPFTEKDFMDLLYLIERARGKWLLKQVDTAPYVLDWAREHGYHVRTVELRLRLQHPQGRRHGRYKGFLRYYLITNYDPGTDRMVVMELEDGRGRGGDSEGVQEVAGGVGQDADDH